MSPFEKAFATARRQGLSEFTFGGKRYNTLYKEEAEAAARRRDQSNPPTANERHTDRGYTEEPEREPPNPPTASEQYTEEDAPDEPQDNLLQRIHAAVVAGGKDASNVARLAVGLNELYPERPMGPLRRLGHTRTTTNKARNLVRRLRGLPELNLPDYNEVAFPDRDQYEGGFKK